MRCSLDSSQDGAAPPGRQQSPSPLAPRRKRRRGGASCPYAAPSSSAPFPSSADLQKKKVLQKMGTPTNRSSSRQCCGAGAVMSRPFWPTYVITCSLPVVATVGQGRTLNAIHHLHDDHLGGVQQHLAPLQPAPGGQEVSIM